MTKSVTEAFPEIETIVADSTYKTPHICKKVFTDGREYKSNQTVGRVFAEAKEEHAMRYTQYRGCTQVTNWVTLKFAAMNLKNRLLESGGGFVASFPIPDFQVCIREIREEPGLRRGVTRVLRQAAGLLI